MKSRTSPTAYAKAQGVNSFSIHETSEGVVACEWWLRSPGSYQQSAANVTADGSLGFDSASSPTNYAVRPALWVSLE